MLASQYDQEHQSALNRTGDMTMKERSSGGIFHIGWVVPDLKASMDHLGAALGLQWSSPVQRSVSITGRGGSNDVSQAHEVLVTFSTTGPPYIELIESLAGSLWDAGGSARPHHVGRWVEDLAGASERLTQGGCALICRGANANSGQEYFAFHDSGHGLLVELLDESIRQSWERDWASRPDAR